jgi:hypothetical protein
MISRIENKNKSGQFFALYAVILTLVMCGIVIGLYISHQGKVVGSLVSPVAVLEIRDDLDIFEMREQELVLSSVDESGLDVDLFKDEFLNGVSEEMRTFIFSNLTWDGKILDPGTYDENSFLKNVLYSVEKDSRGLILERSRIGKTFLLTAQKESDTDFPIEFVFEFEKKYLISKHGDGFKVEVL